MRGVQKSGENSVTTFECFKTGCKTPVHELRANFAFLDPLKKRPKTPKNAPKRPKTPPKRPKNAPKRPKNARVLT